MKKNLRIFVIVLMTFIRTSLLLQSQNTLEHQAPTVQIGLDGLNFGKGTLDAQLITQMLAEKQKEVALKIVQNMFLSKMGNAGGSFYSFTDNIIRGVLTEKDPDVITKNILENTVNITFTCAFADYYIKQLQLSQPYFSSKLENFNRLATSSNYTLATFTQSTVSNGLIGIRKASVGGALSGNSKQSISLDDPESTALIALIIDMASEVIRQNTTLKELGIMQVSYSQSYDKMNIYLAMQRINTVYFNTYVQPVFLDMQENLSSFTNMIGLLYYHINSNSYRLNSKILMDNSNVVIASSAPNDLAGDINSIESDLEVVISSLQAKMFATTDTAMKRKMQYDLQTISDFHYYLAKAVIFSLNHPIAPATDPRDLITYSDIVYTIYADIIPKLNKMAVWDVNILDEISSLESILKVIEDHYINVDNTNNLSNEWIRNNVENFLDILSKSYQFDKATTFSSSVKILADLEKIFPNERIKDAMSFINTYVRDFIAIKKDNNKNEYVDFNIESFISKLSEIKSEKLNRGSLLFSVGTNTVWFNKSQVIESGDTIKNFSFVSEKIGFKLKLKDNSFWMTRNPGESYTIGGNRYTKITTPYEPIVSDIHIIFYGSGILYNIINAATSKKYNSPLLGTGFGWTFFNSLDLDLTLGVPLKKNEDVFTLNTHDTPSLKINSIYYGISFGFPFIEYIDRVNQNRKDNQNKKILSKLNKN